MSRTLAIAVLLALAAALPGAAASDFHIAGGRPAAEGAYPFMAAFLYGEQQGCGGSLVAPDWILTAAHCVEDDQGQLRTDPSRMSFVISTNRYARDGERLTVESLVVHPRYDATRKLNDLALVHTRERSDVEPVRLVDADDGGLNDPPTVGLVLGYGRTSTEGTTSPDLLEADVDVVDDASCATAGYGSTIVDVAMVCAGNPSNDPAAPGRDSCQGDSGGPLVARVGEEVVQFGVVSFGARCGVDAPGVYTQVSTYREWVDGIIDGSLRPGDDDPGPAGDLPVGASAPARRIAVGDGNDPVANAIAVSQDVFDQQRLVGVLASSASFADALGGSSLGLLGPVLYTDASGQLGPDTLAEFQRVVRDDGFIYVLGGEAVVSAEAEAALAGAGFRVVRLAGDGRQETALLIAREVRAINEVLVEGGTPFDAVIVAFEGNWPDAVAVGQVSAWFSLPLLLTPADRLGGPAETYLRGASPSRVIVLGGEGVIAPSAVAEIEAITGTGSVIRLGGPSRLATGAAIATYAQQELFPRNEEVFGFPFTPTTIVIANLRRDDAYAHLLGTAPILGNYGAVIAPVEAPGTVVDQVVLDSVCGMNADVLVIGGPELVAESAVDQVRDASAGTGCTAAVRR